MLGIPVAITEAAHAGLNPGCLGLTGLPCGLTVDAIVATGIPLMNVFTAPIVIVPGPNGGTGNPVTEAGKPTTAAGNGIT